MPDIPTPEDLGTYLKELERRVRILETAPRLQSSSVTDGTTTVLDSSGAVKTQFGLLSDGTYGLGVLNPSGELVNINNTLFPEYGAYTPTQNVTATSFTALPNGPTVQAKIGESGVALVTCYADIGLNQINQTGYIGYTSPSVGAAATGWLSISGGVATTIAGTAGKTAYVSNLAPGLQTFTACAFVTTGNVNFSNVTLIVQPF